MQAALALAPLNLIEAAHKDAQWRAWGNEIFVTAVLAIIVCASVGMIAVNVLSSRCLNKVQLSQFSQPLRHPFPALNTPRRSCTQCWECWGAPDPRSVDHA